MWWRLKKTKVTQRRIFPPILASSDSLVPKLGACLHRCSLALRVPVIHVSYPNSKVSLDFIGSRITTQLAPTQQFVIRHGPSKDTVFTPVRTPDYSWEIMLEDFLGRPNLQVFPNFCFTFKERDTVIIADHSWSRGDIRIT